MRQARLVEPEKVILEEVGKPNFGEKPSVDIGLVQDKEVRMIGTLMESFRVYRTVPR